MVSRVTGAVAAPIGTAAHYAPRPVVIAGGDQLHNEAAVSGINRSITAITKDTSASCTPDTERLVLIPGADGRGDFGSDGQHHRHEAEGRRDQQPLRGRRDRRNRLVPTLHSNAAILMGNRIGWRAGLWRSAVTTSAAAC